MTKRMRKETDTFVKELANDVEIAKVRMDADPSASNLREFVRTTYAAIEAQTWSLKMDLLNGNIDKVKLSVHEISALKEETYYVSEKGDIKVQSRGYPLKTGLKLVINILINHGLPIKVDYNSPNWGNLDEVSRIRNRITHPKSTRDITVSREEADRCYEAFLLINRILINSLMASMYKSFSDFQAKVKARKPSEGA